MIIISLVMDLIIVRLALPGIVKNYVNKKLNHLPGYTGHADNINIYLFRGVYGITPYTEKEKRPCQVSVSHHHAYGPVFRMESIVQGTSGRCGRA
jgi:hypothetical protein